LILADLRLRRLPSPGTVFEETIDVCGAFSAGCIERTFARHGNDVLLDRILAQNRLVKRELHATLASDTGERRLVYEIRPTAI
jgi:hypothetical protein